MNEHNEIDIMHQIMYAVSLAGYKIFRVNVGKVKQADGRWFSTGLPPGHPDLYGYRPDGQIFYIEVKTKAGKVSPAQQNFIEKARAAGALAGVAHDAEEALSIVRGFQRVGETHSTQGLA